MSNTSSPANNLEELPYYSEKVDDEESKIGHPHALAEEYGDLPPRTPLAPPPRSRRMIALPSLSSIKTRCTIALPPDFWDKFAMIFGSMLGVGIVVGLCGLFIHSADQSKLARDAEEAVQKAATEAAQAAKDAVDQAVINASVKGPEVFWEILKEFKAFRETMVEELQALRAATVAVTARA